MKRLFMVAVLVAASLSLSIDGYAQWGKTDLGNTYGSRRGGGYVGGTDRGFKITGEAGAMGNLGWCTGGFEFNALVGCGYQFNPYFYLGGLIGGGYHEYNYWGLSHYDYYTSGGVFIFTSDVRAYLIRGKVAPFFFARVGLEYYGGAYWSQYSSGYPDYVYESYGYGCYGIAPYIGGGPGLRIMLGRKVGLTIQPSVRLGFDFNCILGGSVGVEF
ncbi:MAG: hypothetical protein ACI4TU_11660 [Candidatus Cryptobacteroides sp.]